MERWTELPRCSLKLVARRERATMKAAGVRRRQTERWFVASAGSVPSVLCPCTLSNMTGSIPLSLPNLLRGRLAEQILTVLLERAGYRVTRLGIEVLFDEIKYLDREAYLALGLPKELRTLPDLLVADPGVKWAKLIEVKFRRSFSRSTAEELLATLAEQRVHWPQSYAVIVVGRPFLPDARFHQDYIRVIPPGEVELLRGPRGIDIPSDERSAMELVWAKLPMLTSIFKFRDFEPFGDSRDEHGWDFLSGADFITAAIRELGNL